MDAEYDINVRLCPVRYPLIAFGPNIQKSIISLTRTNDIYICVRACSARLLCVWAKNVANCESH